MACTDARSGTDASSARLLEVTSTELDGLVDNGEPEPLAPRLSSRESEQPAQSSSSRLRSLGAAAGILLAASAIAVVVLWHSGGDVTLPTSPSEVAQQFSFSWMSLWGARSLKRTQERLMFANEVDQNVTGPRVKGHWTVLEDVDFPSGHVAHMQVRSGHTLEDSQMLADAVERHGWLGYVVKGREGVAIGGTHGPHSREDLVPSNHSTRFHLFVQDKSTHRSTPAPTPRPTPAPTPMPTPKPPPEQESDFTDMPVCGDSEGTRTMYMYRAQSDSAYAMENVNAADLPGVLWYLQNEVVQMCPRKYGITRIIRLKVSVQYFVPFVAFDVGMCTVPNIETNRVVQVGCQPRDYAGWHGYWYSLPGKCPNLKFTDKYEGCDNSWENAGGHCGCGRKLGQDGCHYHYEYAGEVNLNELTGFGDQQGYQNFCSGGGMEYLASMDSGINHDWWQGFNDHDKALWRINQIYAAFAAKYPGSPVTLGPNNCI